MIDENAPGASSACTVLGPEGREVLEASALEPSVLEPSALEPSALEPSMASPRAILIEFVTDVRDGNAPIQGRETLSARLDIEVTEFGYRHLVAPVEFARQFEPTPLTDAALADIVDEWLSLLP